MGAFTGVLVENYQVKNKVRHICSYLGQKAYASRLDQRSSYLHDPYPWQRTTWPKLLGLQTAHKWQSFWTLYYDREGITGIRKEYLLQPRPCWAALFLYVRACFTRWPHERLKLGTINAAGGIGSVIRDSRIYSIRAYILARKVGKDSGRCSIDCWVREKIDAVVKWHPFTKWHKVRPSCI